MIKYYCDRCGDETDIYNFLNITIGNEIEDVHEYSANLCQNIHKANQMMLCNTCLKEIIDYVQFGLEKGETE